MTTKTQQAPAKTRPDLPDIVGILAKAIKAKRASRPRNGRIYPSDLGMALGPEHSGCPRYLWEVLHDAEQKEQSAGELLMFQMGDLLEEFLVELLTEELPKHGWEVAGHQDWVRHLDLNGRLDLKIRHLATGFTVIVDVKSKRGNAFGHLREAKPGDELQVQFYVAAEDADAGMLLYGDREGQNFVRAFDVSRDDARPAEAVRRLVALRDGDPPPPLKPKVTVRKNKKSPDAVYLELPWQVKWCRLRQCVCDRSIRRQYGGLPNKIVARIRDDGVVVPEHSSYVGWIPLVVDLLREQYPDREFKGPGE